MSVPASRREDESTRLLDPSYDDVVEHLTPPGPSSGTHGHHHQHIYHCSCGATHHAPHPAQPTESIRARLDSILSPRSSPGPSFPFLAPPPDSPVAEYGRIQLPSGSPVAEDVSEWLRSSTRHAGCAREAAVAAESGLPLLWALLRFVQGVFSLTVFIMLCRFEVYRTRLHERTKAADVWLIIFNFFVILYTFGTLIYRRANPRTIKKFVFAILLADIAVIVLHFFTIITMMTGWEVSWYPRSVRAWKPIAITNLVLYFLTMFIIVFRHLARLELRRDVMPFYDTTRGNAGRLVARVKEHARERRERRRRLDQLAQGLLDGTLRIVQVDGFHEMGVPVVVRTPEQGVQQQQRSGQQHVAPEMGMVGGAGVAAVAGEADGRPPAYDAGVHSAGDVKTTTTEFLLHVQERGE
ncbi:hypothetical protein DFH27DRAFT_396371 [Peziza echinospora]|nr:hypothetical protein DFH27DRAFT_396371 [Peziza echinospora]